MAYDEELADRLRAALATESGLTERRMFGGLAFLLDGRMAVAASGARGGGLLLRCDPAETETLAREPHVDRFVMRGREMNGWLRVGDAAVAEDGALRSWVGRGVAYARSLPPK